MTEPKYKIGQKVKVIIDVQGWTGYIGTITEITQEKFDVVFDKWFYFLNNNEHPAMEKYYFGEEQLKPVECCECCNQELKQYCKCCNQEIK